MTIPSGAKQLWRSKLLAARRDRPESERAEARERVSAHLLALVDALVVESTDRLPTICLYLPLASEPLDPALPARIADLGCRVLVPIAEPGLPLDWAELSTDSIVAESASSPEASTRSALGIVEPTGARLGADEIASAHLIVIPALAVDRRGVRLGRGGGYYDRSLALLPARLAGRVIAVVFDEEFVAELPRDEHDIRVSGVITPSGGFHDVESGSVSGQVAEGGQHGASSN